MDDRESVAAELSHRFNLSIVADHSTASFLRFGIASWDQVPGMLSGTGWRPSQRLLLLELEKRPGTRSITIRFELGPGNNQIRERVFTALKSRGADVGGSWPLSDKWRQLASKLLFKAKDDDARPVEQIVGTTRESMMKFLEHHLPIYDEAIRSLE
jgi:hypothetical protein